MGTQQILLIVLSVIIVGVAIAVGITMFNNQAYNSNQQAVAGELQNYGAQAVQFWKTPQSQGGASQLPGAVGQETVSRFIGFDPAAYTNATENGSFYVYAASDTLVTMIGVGNHMKNSAYAKVQTDIWLPSGTITSRVGTATSLTDYTPVP